MLQRSCCSVVHVSHLASHFTPFRPISSNPLETAPHLIPSNPILSQSNPSPKPTVLSDPTLSYPILSDPTRSYPILILSNPNQPEPTPTPPTPPHPICPYPTPSHLTIHRTALRRTTPQPTTYQHNTTQHCTAPHRTAPHRTARQYTRRRVACFFLMRMASRLIGVTAYHPGKAE